MRVTILGHAGLHIETPQCTILCDPWVNPAFFAAWFPFPDNSWLDWHRYGAVDLLYVSHLHRDHFDPANLSECVDRDATVLLPDHPTNELQDELAALGFRSFCRIPNGERVHYRGLSVMILALTAPSDGAVGDSALAIDDGTTRILNQNDAKLIDFEPVSSFGPYHVHFLQFSGANWWPWAYQLPESVKRSFGAAKRANGLARARRFVENVKAHHVIPSAGPPCFLDDELFGYNDLGPSEWNTFPDQTVFLDDLRKHGLDGVFTVPGTVLELNAADCDVTHPASESEIKRPFEDKAEYLREYAAWNRPRIQTERESWSKPGVDVLAGLKGWFEPLLAMGEHVCAGIGGPLLLQAGEEDVLIDFTTRTVREYVGEKYRYSFSADRSLIERLIAERQVDWVNSLFLSMRFSASRIGKFNEYLYVFLTCLSPMRMKYADAWYASRGDSGGEIRIGDWCVPRRCPHRGADLAQFGEIAGDVLTCQMHGWRFELPTRRCLTSPGYTLRGARAVGPETRGT